MFCVKPVKLLNIILLVSLIVLIIFLVKEIICFQGHCDMCMCESKVSEHLINVKLIALCPCC